MVGGARNVGDGGKPVTSAGSSLYQLMSTYRDQGFPNNVKRGGIPPSVEENFYWTAGT